MIGYYAHHHGSGHINRATAIAVALNDDVTILSSVPRPKSWTGKWIDLPLDTDRPAVDQGANGALHWVPVGSLGLAARMRAISEWIVSAAPVVVVVDVSVEVALLVRLHGIRVVVVAQPGDRRDDPHTLAYRVADAIIGCWPADVAPLEVAGTIGERIEHVGGVSRLGVNVSLDRRKNQITVLTGTGGRGPSALAVVAARARMSLGEGYRWVFPENASAEEIEKALRESRLVFAHCGANAIAEIAASRTHAVLVSEARPFEEQLAIARAIAGAELPATVVAPDQNPDWQSLVADLWARPRARWERWVDGGAATRAAAIIESVASRGPAVS